MFFFLFFAYKSTKVAGTSRDESFTLDRCVAARWGVYIMVVSMQRVKICPCWWTFMGSFTGLLKWSTAPAHTFKHKVSWTQTNGIRRRREKKQKTKNGRQQAACFPNSWRFVMIKRLPAEWSFWWCAPSSLAAHSDAANTKSFPASPDSQGQGSVQHPDFEGLGWWSVWSKRESGGRKSFSFTGIPDGSVYLVPLF